MLETSALRNDQAHDVAAPVDATSWMKVRAKASTASRTDPPMGGGACSRPISGQRRPYQFLEHRLLVLEVQVDRALATPARRRRRRSASR